MLEVAIKELKDVAINFYTLTHIQIVLYNSERQIIYAYPDKLCPYCQQIRSNKKLQSKCLDCDNIGLDICAKTRRPYIYNCHMNLVEAVAPICENNIIIGYMMIGQMLDVSNIQTIQNKVYKISSEYNLDYDSLLENLKLLPSVNKKYIIATVKMLSMCIFYLYFNNIVYNKTDILSYEIKEYINIHLSAPLSIDSLCSHFYISRSKLYSLSTYFSGMGISDYIRSQRIEKAKQLLSTTEKPICLIAEEVGFNDSNYFTRIFKSTQNMTPKTYRNTYKNSSDSKKK